MTALKRPLDDSSPDQDESLTAKPPSPTLAALSSAASSFRNVSACNRCRLRKNRCDQRLPACASCEKAHVKCVGYDPITKREIPRSYVYYLETRVAHLESLLQQNSIPFSPAETFNPALDTSVQSGSSEKTSPVANDAKQRNGSVATEMSKEEEEREKVNKLISNIGMVSVQGASDPRYLGSTSGISFARVVFAAVKSSVSGASSERGSSRGIKTLPGGGTGGGGTTMRDSFFGLHTKPVFKQAPFPDKDLGLRLVELYFEHANPQVPILHRGEFMEMFDRVYASDERSRTARESYMLNIVFAIGAGIIMGSFDSGTPNSESAHSPIKTSFSPPSNKKRKINSGVQHQPEEYHASAIVHLESFLGAAPAADRPDGFGGGLEELQAVLLLAGFALLRPVAPGLWYIVGVAVRLGVDLGLHYEDGVDLDGINALSAKPASEERSSSEEASQPPKPARIDPREYGRRQWVRDLRRRLWWCVYSLDRLVSTCVGRPFGISDQVVTTEFPSLLDDKYISKEGLVAPPSGSTKPSYKYVAYHYFRLRLLQSEMVQVLQHRQAVQARIGGANQRNPFIHSKLPSPFLIQFDSFRSWRADIDRRLWEWKESAPNQMETSVQFSPLFFELNYWQAIITLFRQSLSVPPILAGDASTNGDVSSPSLVDREEREDEDMVYLKVAEAGQKVLKIYRQLHRVHLVNYTFLATHHLFMAGISFLYAIWHSPVVRSHLSLDDVDFTVLAATSVLGDLVEKCPPAESCRDAFDRMSKATIQMCMSTTGFGPQALLVPPRTSNGNNSMSSPTGSTISMTGSNPDTDLASNHGGYFQASYPVSSRSSRRPQPRFDMNLRDLFSEEETDARSFGRISNQIAAMRPPPFHPLQQQQQQQQASSRSSQQSIKQEPPISPQLTRASHRTRFQQQQQQYASTSTPRGIDESSPHNISPRQQHHHPHSHPHPHPNLSAAPQISPYFHDQPQQQAAASSAYTSAHQAAYPGMDLFSDLDFLASAPLGAGGSGPDAAGGGNGAGDGMLDLGFGMGGFDVNHDWSEGGGLDLFDGFFFGGGGA